MLSSIFSLYKMKVIIIGAGIGSISLSIRLANEGYDVHVFEANDYAGGKLHSFQLSEYRFDGGPSLFTMPHYVTELFDLVGKNPNDFFEFEKLDESCRYFWEDGTRLTGYSDPNAFAQEVQDKLGVSSMVLIDYFNYSKNIYDHSGKIFLEKSLHKAATWLSKDTFNSLVRIGQFDLFKSMNQANEDRIKEPHLVQLFNRFATYNGSNPYKAPGILNVIPWFEHGFGTFAPKGGMQEIPKSLQKLAENLGVSFHFNSLVQEVIVENGKAIGVRVNDMIVSSEIVASNADVYFTYKRLMKGQPAPEKTLKQESSSSAVVFYWGVQKSFDELSLHNILFSKDYKQEFKEIFDENRLPTDPTVYINISSKSNPNDAPKGSENWFVMVNAPAHRGQDWKSDVGGLKERVIQKINNQLDTDIRPLIRQEKIWTPEGIEEDTRSYQGALYGTSSNDQTAAFLRHPNFSSKIKNLYFCGGSVHPGGGIPLALLSAKITSEMIIND